MNKKFSTLVAVLLAAGAWTTLGAAVTVTEAKAVKAGTYLIGNDADALKDEEYDILLDPITGEGSADAVAVDKNTATWTLVEGDGGAFKLQGAESNFFTASNEEGAGGLALTFEAAAGEKRVEVQFTIENGKLKLANTASFDKNTDIKGKDLYLKFDASGAATLDDTGTELIFSNWEADPVTPVVPGQGDLTVAENGDVTISSLPTNKTIDAPLYLALDGKYLTLTSEGISTLEAVPTAAESMSSSWRWESGKLVSIAAERAGEDAKYVKAALKTKALTDYSFTLVEASEATTFAVSGDNLTFTAGTSQDLGALTAKVSTTLVAVVDKVTIGATQGVIVGASNLPIFSSVPSDYVLVTLVADDGTVKYLKDNGSGVVSAATVTTIGNDYDEYLWKVSRSESGNFYNYSFTNLASEKAWKLGGYSTFKAETDAVEGINLSIDGTKIDVDASTAGGSTARFAFYQSPVAAKTQAELNKLLAPGFDVTIKIAEKNNDAIKGIEVFGKTLYPIASATTSTSVQLVDKVDKDGKVIADETNYLVLDKKGWDGISASALNGEFIWVSAKDFKDTKKNENWLSEFQVRYRSGKPSADVMETLAVMDGASVFGNAFILSVDKINYLTTKTSITSKETWPYIKLASDNIVDVKTLLGKFWNIKFAETNVDDNEQYKLNGVLAVAYDANANKDVADYVKANTVLTSAPETQWAVVSVESDGTFTMQNRENSSIKVSGLTLRKNGEIYTIATTATAYAEVLKGDQVTLTAVESHTKFDGYRTATVNELRNQVFNIGQYHNETGNSTAFWTENHQGNGTHQLGVVTEEANAVKWRLRLDMKPKSVTTTTSSADYGKELAEVDTVLVITKMAVWKDDKFKNEEKADTLAILPYQIQNKGNLEYVIFNDNKNLKYYACDENADVEPSALRFALKAKPNNTYNVVALAKRTDKDEPVTTLGSTKVYVANSTQWGSLKQIKTYSEDNNSLMQVLPIDKPEYRKIAAAWGDTVRIYRDEYPTEELFEKRDAKSVVDKDTLSFLNVDNSITGANPALFVDTAYVNRVAADGTVNTCYQYLLAVNVDKENSYYCPYNPEHNTDEWRKEHNGPCADAMENRAVKGRFLINLVDTAFAYKQDHLHNNPYINMVEADENLAKLSFVEGIHANDTLYITRKGGEVVKLAMDTTAFNVAKFAFRYVNNEEGSFKIQTQYKNYDAKTLKAFENSASDEGYLRWVNGTIVVTNRYSNGETFNMEENYAGDPTANEDVTVSSISVAATNGAVIIKGAEGKKVSIVNVLGQTIANTVITSSEATIAAPAGVVVVSVEGEAAVKAIVK